ncbi:hypothetical protein H2201_009091 [Coniosporium apollinis]|uniref:ARB-07466-like C-terminal domain-containing protein n=1 Tax=Coniosporium apollinis TaxID=61459 RepID=A0ABQ9NER2_9PEZI|nr:hypothetical protein H2201_009091 [Coniosporium apollinis]
MHLSSILFGATLLGAPIVHASVLTERAVVDGPCTGSGGNPGVCIATAKCSSGGGISISGACPGTPADIKCCTKTSCGSGGNCRWTSQCTTGNTASGLCPGPADFKVRNEEGRPIAEWIMNNRGSLNLKYVIWGQKIWSPSRDAVGPWTGWRVMENRGDNTQNHWDHVHVSYNG